MKTGNKLIRIDHGSECDYCVFEWKDRPGKYYVVEVLRKK